MATDYTTSPINKAGKVVFAVLCGLLTVLIRLYGSLTEGVSFAILIGNILSPSSRGPPGPGLSGRNGGYCVMKNNGKDILGLPRRP